MASSHTETRSSLRLAGSFVVVVAAMLPGLALAAGGGGDGHGDGHAEGPSFWMQVLNTAILLAVVVYFARKPLSDYFSSERESVKAEIASSSELLAEAERKNAEWQRKLSALDAELADIRETTRRRADDERAQILAEASEAAERIQRDAAAAIEQDLRKAKTELRAEVAELASRLAAERVRQNMNDGDRQRLVDEFITDIQRSGAEN